MEGTGISEDAGRSLWPLRDEREVAGCAEDWDSLYNRDRGPVRLSCGMQPGTWEWWPLNETSSWSERDTFQDLFIIIFLAPNFSYGLTWMGQEEVSGGTGHRQFIQEVWTLALKEWMQWTSREWTTLPSSFRPPFLFFPFLSPSFLSSSSSPLPCYVLPSLPLSSFFLSMGRIEHIYMPRGREGKNDDEE